MSGLKKKEHLRPHEPVLMSRATAKKYFQDLLFLTNDEAGRLAEEYLKLAVKYEKEASS